MKPLALSLCLLSFVASAADPKVAQAQKALDTARANMIAAVARIEKDPPSNADLDAAHVAVEALKTAIEAGAEQEQNDLDYAKAALSARKDLREKRTYVEERRAKIKLFDARRAIELALPPMAEKGKKLEAKDPDPKDFDDARAAIVEVRKVVDGARALGKEDPRFAAFVAETDANLARREKAIDDRATALSVGNQRPLLEESRKALTAAIAALGKGATDAQFSDADKAVSALARRLEDGKDLEGKDGGYREAAGKARGELSAGKKKMDELWTVTGLARLKGEIEPARKDLATAARGVRGRKPTPEQLAEARTAAIVVRKLVEKFQPEAARSQAFAQYVTEVQSLLVDVEGELARRNLDGASADVNQALKTIAKPAPTDENFAEANSALGVLEKTLAGVESKEPWANDARALLRDARSSTSRRRIEVDVEGLRATLTTTVSALSTAATDAQFDDANKAVAALLKRVDDEKDLEAKDAAYRPAATKVRSELASARKRIDDLWASTGLARLKAQIESAKKDLAASARVVHGRKPTAEQLAEAKTAAIVARKLVEKLQPEAAKFPTFGQYLTDVQALVTDVEQQLQVRSLESASADVNQGLKSIAKNNPPDDAFSEVNAAVGILEKTMATIDPKDPALGPYMNDAKALLRDAKSSAARRRIEVDVERQKAKVEEQRKKVASLMEVLTRAGFTREQEQAAEDAVTELKTTLEAGTELVAKDRGYAAYDREIKARLNELNVKLTARKVTLTAGEGRALLVELTATGKAKLESARQPESTDAQLADATKAVDALTQALDSHAALEQQDYGYFAQSNKGRDDLIRLMEALERAKAVREIRKHTVEPLSAGTAAVNAAASADLRTQKAQYEKAIALFKSCNAEGAGLLRDYPTLTTVPVVVDGRPTTPTAALAACTQQIGATEVLLKQVVPLLSFEDGPKKAYEAAKGLLAKGNKNDALAQFDECIATGVILSAKSPELKERNFTVAGADSTLTALIQVCRAQSKTLRGK